MNEFKEFEINELTKTSRLRNNAAGLIDGFIVITLYTIFTNLLRILNVDITETLYLNIIVIFLLYRLITILTIGRTIGMTTLKIKFLKENNNKFTLKEKLLAVIMFYINGIDCYNIK